MITSWTMFLLGVLTAVISATSFIRSLHSKSDYQLLIRIASGVWFVCGALLAANAADVIFGAAR